MTKKERDKKEDKNPYSSRRFLKSQAKYKEDSAHYLEWAGAEASQLVDAARMRVRTGELRKAIRNYDAAAALYHQAASHYKSASGKEYNEMFEQEYKDCVRNADRLRAVISGKSKLLTGKGKTLESKMVAAAIISIGGIVFGLFFLSSNITGNVIGNLTRTSSNWIGAGLFVIGLVGTFFWMKDR